MFNSAASAYNLQSFLSIGTNAGCTVTLNAVSGKRTYLDSIHGFNDKKSVLEIRNDLTGTVSTTTGDATVTGTNTLFLTELVVGDTIRVTDTSEVLKVLSIASNTSLEATTNASNNEASSALVRLIARQITVTNETIDYHCNGAMWSSIGKSLTVDLLTSTADCSLTVTGFNL